MMASQRDKLGIAVHKAHHKWAAQVGLKRIWVNSIWNNLDEEKREMYRQMGEAAVEEFKEEARELLASKPVEPLVHFLCGTCMGEYQRQTGYFESAQRRAQVQVSRPVRGDDKKQYCCNCGCHLPRR